jgi:hypothetical protein
MLSLHAPHSFLSYKPLPQTAIYDNFVTEDYIKYCIPLTCADKHTAVNDSQFTLDFFCFDDRPETHQRSIKMHQSSEDLKALR